MSNLLQLKNGMKAFGTRVLFQDASFAVNESEKVGVIGPNGAGKSTLFRVLVGEQSLDGGDITRKHALRLGYLAQEDKWEGEPTVEEFLTSQTATPIWELKQLAPSFGLDLSFFEKKVKSLSGGYRMRVKLLHLLASKPDLMLLDEPTNYLDLETLVVLENFLQNTTSAFLLISHDREFLRRTTDHILEIEAGEMTKYAGQIDDYFEQKELLREQTEKAAMSLASKRKDVLDFAAKFGAKATKARQVQSRLKQLDKMETIEIKRLPVRAKIKLPAATRTGKSVIAVRDGELGYGEKVILRDVRLELSRGDHLGVVGVNGAGKSTLLKALSGDMEPLRGSVERGMGVEIGYYAQHVAERLDPDDTVIEAMSKHAHPEIKRQEILDLAGSLLFSGDDVTKKIRPLSGGEKSRVALGQILLQRASCLILDEPTNHLDFDTVEALTQALANYEGTVVIVSHDRGFVRRTASKILEIRDGKAEFYPGTYDEYVWSVQKGALSQRDSQDGAGVDKSQSMSELADSLQDSTPKFNYKDRKKQLEKDVKAREKEMQSIDADTMKLREQILAVTERLISVSGAEAQTLARELGDLQGRVESLEERYLECLEVHEEANLELERLENRRTD